MAGWASGRIMARRTRALAAILAVITLGGASCSFLSRPGAFARPFDASSPWRQAIPADARVDPNSASMIASVQPTPALNANLVAYGIPIYAAGTDTTTYTVPCTRVDYGICPFAGWPVTIPDGAEPNTGSDGVLVSVQEASGIIFEFWRAARDGDTWTTAFGAVNSLHGSGWGGAATGSGASRLAGVVRVAEIADGEIPHALALQSNNACPTFRAPALKSDGTSTRADCIPEGARLQLDPELDLSSLNLRPGELAVARAMQRYGGFLMDVAKTPLSVSFEREGDPAAGEVGQTYSGAGFRWDYDAMENVPWDKLRVLK
ncbi:hypothetical protein [Mycolicibacterium austroafricanum]|uniref:hypothetical protein n=1 Tax=Mycolicibacterium austroafricanum TaxID=39687 RepID=UPI001CA36DBB|nr:hypothetical protein [Mycolicibacterium austroafricanum]QZT62290.1 hypothetical protein JN085_25945 [Mycolicibacterium austroafricanum]